MQRDYPICATCGVQYPPEVDRAHCRICEDERQYVGHDGQQWTSLAELARRDHHLELGFEAHGLAGAGVTPSFAIGQRALLVPGEGGTLMWDCPGFIDDEAITRLEKQGGLAAIALSHPHYYSTMVEWSRAFGDIPIYVHEQDAAWLARSENVELWSGPSREVLPGRTLYNAGVHFAGGTVLHWAHGAGGRGALATGDIFTVVADRRWVGFMYSYPNLIPEHPQTIVEAVNLTHGLDYDALYGAWWGRVVPTRAREAVLASAHRYLRHVGADAAGLPPCPDYP